MIVAASNIDLGIACNPNADPKVRQAAWDRYEVECWYLAYRERGLLIRNMDEYPSGPERESMRTRVMKRIKLPNTSGIDTNAKTPPQNPLRT